MKLCGCPMSCWHASWMMLRFHRRESARVTTCVSGMAKEHPKSVSRWPCGHLRCAVQRSSMSSSSGSSSRSEWARLCAHRHMHTQWWTHGCAQNVHTIVCTPVCTHTQCVRRVVCTPWAWMGNIQKIGVCSDLLFVATSQRLVPQMDLPQWYTRGCCGGGGSASPNPKPFGPKGILR